MSKVLIQFAHPAFQNSRIQRAMLSAVTNLEYVYINDLYEHYPNFYIDIEREQQLLREHDVIVFQHPFYWFSAPSIIKEWQDLVLLEGFAYGAKRELANKYLMTALSAGASSEAYCVSGKNCFTVSQFLTPFEGVAAFCDMHYLSPFIINDARKISNQQLAVKARTYQELIVSLTKKEHVTWQQK